MNQTDHWDFSKNEWQRPEFFALLTEAFTQPIKVVYDIGACVGGWSEVVHRHFNPTIYAFEPFPENFKALMSHTGETNAVNFPFGVYYGKKEAKAMWRGSNIGAIYVDEVDTTMSVPTNETFHLKTLEELDLPPPDLIKLDVEGAEKNIIEHSPILKKVPQLLIEWHYRETMDATDFFAQYLPHKVVMHLENNMYLLRL